MTYKIIGVGSNAKTIKGDGSEYLTAITYLKPYKTKVGKTVHNMCSMAHVAQCHEGCLFTAGRGQMINVQTARLNKTLLWIKDRAGYLELLRSDLTTFQRRCEMNNVQACYRPNGTTDIQWENYGIIEEFPGIQFYDYTKIIKRIYLIILRGYTIMAREDMVLEHSLWTKMTYVSLILKVWLVHCMQKVKLRQTGVAL